MEDDSSKTFLRSNAFNKEHAHTYDNVCSNCGHDLSLSKEFGMFFCKNCGYMFSFDKEKIGRLDYYPKEDTRFSDKEHLRCKYYVPFSADSKDVEMEFERWKSELKLMPPQFKETVRLTNIRKILVPHAMISCHGTAVLNGKVSAFEKKFWMKLKTETTTYEHAAEMDFAGIPVCLNNSIQRGLAEAAEPFALNSISEFSPSAISPDVKVLDINEHIADLDEHVSMRILKGMESYSKKAHQKYGNDVVFIANESEYKDLSFDSCYLPFYLAEYEFNGKKYSVIANGRTGNIACDLPSCTEIENKIKKRREILFKAVTGVPYIFVALLASALIILSIIADTVFTLYIIFNILFRTVIYAFIATFIVFILRAIFINLAENAKEGTHYPLPCQADAYIDKSSVTVLKDKVIDTFTSMSSRDPFLNNVFQPIFDRLFYGSRRL